MDEEATQASEEQDVVAGGVSLPRGLACALGKLLLLGSACCTEALRALSWARGGQAATGHCARQTLRDQGGWWAALSPGLGPT